MPVVSSAAAFAAGLLSFASPCVLPLVPAYLCFLAGRAPEQLAEERAKVLPAAVAFVLGFSTVFVALGASASVLGGLIGEHLQTLSFVAGLAIIVLGLHYAGLFRLSFLEVDRRLSVTAKPAGLIGAFTIGLAFAFGWTPCVGPILATILMMAAGQDSVVEGTLLLATYAAGLGVPFLLAATLVRPFLAWRQRVRRHMRLVELAIGGLLVVTGLLILSGRIADLGEVLLGLFPALGRIG